MNQKKNQRAVVNSTVAQQTQVIGEERKEILEQRKILLDLQNQASQSFDKMILTLAGGALTLSLSFIRQTVPEALPGTTWSLALAWLFLILALFTSLFSLYTSQFGIMKRCDELDQEYLGIAAQPQKAQTHFLGRAIQRLGTKLSNLCEYRMTTHWLNVAAIICCIAGISFITLFVVLNFPQLQVPLSK